MPEPHQIDLARALKSLGSDSVEPRIVAIIGAAYIEAYLKALVKKSLPGFNSKLNDRLFGSKGPLFDLGPVIDIARAMRVITPRGWNEAIKIARVRNRFAHDLTIADFDHPEVAKIIDTMDAYRGFKLASDGFYDVDDQNMSRREIVTCLIREFCFSIEQELTGARDWTVGKEDLHVEPHPPSLKKSRGRSRHPPEGLTNQSGQWPFVPPRSSRA